MDGERRMRDGRREKNERQTGRETGLGRLRKVKIK
jgi:hypothetical protein